MKRYITATCLFLSLIPALSFAGETYFTGGRFKAAKSVQILGATATPENLEREANINRIVEANFKKLQYCYERAFAGGPLPKVESVIFFTVSGDGKFSNVTGDLLNIEGSAPNIATLFSCISQQMTTFRAATWDSDNIFRFLVTFESPN